MISSHHSLVVLARNESFMFVSSLLQSAMEMYYCITPLIKMCFN